MSVYSKVGGSILTVVGFVITAVLLHSHFIANNEIGSLGQGLAVGVLMMVSGIYSILQMPFNLVVRTIWSIGFLIGGILPMFMIIGSSQGGLLTFLGVTGVILVIYVGLIGSTIMDLLAKFG